MIHSFKCLARNLLEESNCLSCIHSALSISRSRSLIKAISLVLEVLCCDLANIPTVDCLRNLKGHLCALGLLGTLLASSGGSTNFILALILTC